MARRVEELAVAAGTPIQTRQPPARLLGLSGRGQRQSRRQGCREKTCTRISRTTQPADISLQGHNPSLRHTGYDRAPSRRGAGYRVALLVAGLQLVGGVGAWRRRYPGPAPPIVYGALEGYSHTAVHRVTWPRLYTARCLPYIPPVAVG